MGDALTRLRELHAKGTQGEWKMSGLTDKDIAALWEAHRMFTRLDGAATCSGRYNRKRNLERLFTLGLVQKVQAVIVDGDGWTIEPERWALGYQLTPDGLHLCEQLLEDERAAWEARTP